MTFSIVRFGDVYASAEPLPVLDGRQPQGSGSVASSLVALPGGAAFDWRGGDPARIEAQEVTVEGVWVADTPAALQAKLHSLRALLGKRARLWRADDTEQQWRIARCLEVRSQKEPGSQGHAEIGLRFQLFPGPWNGAARTVNSALDASPKTLTCNNAGNVRVDNAVVTVTAAGSAITQVRVRVANVSDIRWNGNLAVGQTLMLDCGARTARIGSTDAYAGWEYLSGHVVPEWLRLQPGNNSVLIYRTGGSSASTAQITFNDGWA